MSESSTGNAECAQIDRRPWCLRRKAPSGAIILGYLPVLPALDAGLRNIARK
jgi:hypothetical protein